ncbi:MAG: tRNA epoxyqueuosine(34) reductase QueG [Nitrospira sp.]|nr:tRNA epoxyqueuosine(34) reductase QueG [Candidatus Manganitrophaceae bacterium]HIL35351.1 tRNA epoxyqueuosine(34) reductase QueG [Candidatus Manganitrophaceae bacterium]
MARTTETKRAHPEKQNLTSEIKEIALALGFHRVGITSADPASEAGQNYMNWLSDGFSGEMAYLQNTPEVRYDPKRRFPEAQSIISLALNYFPAAQREREGGHSAPAPEGTGKVARYAWGEDYHAIIEGKLKKLITKIEMMGGSCWKGYVDHGPLLERAFAERAGIGFIGKNTNLITTDYGSWVFLAEVVTDLRLTEDPPALPGCGTCRLCLDACPTGALREAYRLDARRCISYLTIENKGPIPEVYLPDMEGWIFGCDICQEVCPYNWKPVPTDEARLGPAQGSGPLLSIDEIRAIPDNQTFKEVFAQTPLVRAKLKGLVRNANALSPSPELPKITRPEQNAEERSASARPPRSASKRQNQSQS